MTILEVYVMFVLPIIAIGIGLGGLWLVETSHKREERRARSQRSASL